MGSLNFTWLHLPTIPSLCCIQGSSCCSPTASANATCNSACFSIQSSVRKQGNSGILVILVAPSVVFSTAKKPHQKTRQKTKKKTISTEKTPRYELHIFKSQCIVHGVHMVAAVKALSNLTKLSTDLPLQPAPRAACIATGRVCWSHGSVAASGCWHGQQALHIMATMSFAELLALEPNLGRKSKVSRLYWETLFEVKGISKGCSASNKLPFSLIVLSHLVTQKKLVHPLVPSQE